MVSRIVSLAKTAFIVFGKERAASRGAAIAFYTITSMAPMLVIVVAVAGLAFGREAATGAIFEQFRGLLGSEGADLLQKAIAGASNKAGGIAASIISVLTLVLGASGVFLELEDALNAIWDTKPQQGLAGMARARVVSLGLVIALGFLLIVSLLVDTGLNALSTYLPFGATLLMFVSIAVTVALLTVLFAAIFKFLPARPIAWRDVTLGAAVTAILFEAGKFLIGMYLGSSSTVTSLGAAGALLAMLFWVYYSAQIFLFGAAFTRAHFQSSEARPARSASATNCPITAAVPALDPKTPQGMSPLSVAVLVLLRTVALIVLKRYSDEFATTAGRPNGSVQGDRRG